MPTGLSRLWRRTRREFRRYRGALPKLRTLDWRDWRTLIRAQVALIRAQLAVRTRPTGQLVSDEPEPSAPASQDRIDDVRRVALAVNRAAAFGMVRARCLARSMALRQLLAEEGIDGASVRVGVQVRGGQFVAHAWVEYAGQVVGDDPESVARYAPLTGMQVADLE